MAISNTGTILNSVSTVDKITELYTFIESMEVRKVKNDITDKDLCISTNPNRQSQYSCTKMYDDDKYFILITVSLKLLKANIVIKKTILLSIVEN